MEIKRPGRGYFVRWICAALLLGSRCLGIERPLPPPPPPPKPQQVVIPLPQPPPERKWHSRHQVKVWMARYEGRIFRTVQLPRCEHIEMVLTYVPAPGETCARVKKRIGAIAVCSGSYHNPKTMSLADYFQRGGQVLMPRRTRRGILTSRPGEVADIMDHMIGGKGVNAVALGSRLVPFQLDGFPKAFADEQTDRMAVGLTKGYVFVVQGKSDLWRLSGFLREGLGCSKAINADGGHVVRGRAPVHIAFRWRRPRPTQAHPAGTAPQTAAGPGPRNQRARTTAGAGSTGVVRAQAAVKPAEISKPPASGPEARPAPDR